MRCPAKAARAGIVAVPVMLILAYGAARVCRRASTSCATRSSPRSSSARCGGVALSAFRHLHALSLRFHLDRRTGGLARAVERGTAAIEFLLSFMLFNVVPTLFEILVVCAILWRLYDWHLRRGHLDDDRRSMSPSPSR